ncbi:hypothetical protein BSLG_006039 [Batrachochytrium salamandrivorans]|nr:hypothetical protein BSLG_006039 [Batrachochytrium salamandrivorans]
MTTSTTSTHKPVSCTSIEPCVASSSTNSTSLSAIELDALCNKFALGGVQTPSLKSLLLGDSNDSVTALTDLIQTRLDANMGETLLELGLEDDGLSMQLSASDFTIALDRIRQCADTLNADTTVLYKRRLKLVANIYRIQFPNLMVTVMARSYSPACRQARVNLFRHKHEIESGRTSSVGTEIMGYDSIGRIVTPSMLGKQRLNWNDICLEASKVGANAGIIGMTKEHLGLALALQVPVYIVITKTDMCPKNVLESTINQLVKILKSPGCRKIPMFIRTIGDVLMTSANFVSEHLLKMFLNILHSNGSNKYDVKAPSEFQITETFSVPGVGTVVSGTVISGIIHTGDSLMLGPDFLGQFVPLHTTIAYKYQAMLHCGGVRQTARIVGMDKHILRTGDRAVVRFRVSQAWCQLLFREGMLLVSMYFEIVFNLVLFQAEPKGLAKFFCVITNEELKLEATRAQSIQSTDNPVQFKPQMPSRLLSNHQLIFPVVEPTFEPHALIYFENSKMKIRMVQTILVLYVPTAVWLLANVLFFSGADAEYIENGSLHNVMMNNRNANTNDHTNMAYKSTLTYGFKVSKWSNGDEQLFQFNICIDRFSAIYFKITGILAVQLPEADIRIFLPRLCLAVYPLDLANRTRLESLASTVLNIAKHAWLDVGRKESSIQASTILAAYEAMKSNSCSLRIVNLVSSAAGCNPNLAKLRLREFKQHILKYAHHMPYFSHVTKFNLHKYLIDILDKASDIIQTLECLDALSNETSTTQADLTCANASCSSPSTRFKT